MKYLVAVDDCFLDRPGGAARVAWDIAQVVRHEGHHVAMVCLVSDEKAGLVSLREEEGIRILRVKKPSLPFWDPRRIFSGLQAATQAVREHFAGEHWDILHTHSPPLGLAVLKALPPSVRVVSTVHSPIVLEYQASTPQQGLLGHIKARAGTPLLQRMERQLMQRSDAVHTLSQFTRVNLDILHGIGDRVTIVPHWKRPNEVRTLSKLEARKQLGWPEDEAIFFTLRHHGPRNGIDLSLHAIAPLVKQQKCRYYVGGSGPLKSYHKALAQELELGDRVTFLGRVSESDLALAYQAADAFLLPTRSLECFGLIILEALSYGCPIISSNAAAIPELMQPILPEMIFPAGNTKAMRECLEAFLEKKIKAPTPQELINYVNLRFGHSTITPQIIKWIEVG